MLPLEGASGRLTCSFPMTSKLMRVLRCTRLAWLRPAFSPKHDPEKACPGLDPGWVPVFGKRSCSTNKLERDDDSKKSHPALSGARGFTPRLPIGADVKRLGRLRQDHSRAAFACGEGPMTVDERGNLVLAFARTLFVNGQATDQTVAAADRLARAVGLRAQIMARWGELQLQSDGKDAAAVLQVAADPAGIDMDRVVSTMRAIAHVESGQLPPDVAMKTIGEISQAPPAPTWLFALAAAVGAVALSVIFGVEHFPTAVLIFVSAGAGAFLRRGLARLTGNVFVQPFSAAILAGVIGGLAVD